MADKPEDVRALIAQVRTAPTMTQTLIAATALADACEQLLGELEQLRNDRLASLRDGKPSSEPTCPIAALGLPADDSDSS